MRWVVVLALALLLAPSQASAMPVVSALLANGVGFFSAVSAALGPVGMSLLRIGAGLILSAVTKARMRQPDAQSGIRSTVTMTGGTNSDHFIFGRYATGGVFVAPPLTWPVNDRRKRMVYVIDLGPVGQTVRTLYINGEPAELTSTVWNEFGGLLRVIRMGGRDVGLYRLLDGTQTAADPYLLRAFGSEDGNRDQFGLDPDFPWQPDMIGRDRVLFIAHFYRDKEEPTFTGMPSLRFEMDGLPLYDPRKDTTAGGTGAHRFANRATWEQTDNPAVMIYNILRGIPLADGTIWGGGADAEDLPLSIWAAAMNACDEQVARAAGGTEPRYRAGIDIRVAEDEPADIMAQLLAACSGDVAEEGGTWYINIGEPALPVYFFSDDDMIVSEASDFEPFPGQAQTVNGVAINFPNPDANWEQTDAPLALDPALVAEDDDQEFIAALSLPACPYAGQVQRLASAYLRDARRFRVHRLSLPPDAAWVPPLSTVSWTSAHNGYIGKLFEIERKVVDLRSLVTQFAVRERDPADYDWSASQEIAVDLPPRATTTPVNYVVPGTVSAHFIADETGAQRRPAIRLSGLPADIGGIIYQVRIAGGAAVSQGTAWPIDGVLLVSDGILPGVAYEIRWRPSGDGLVGWSQWYAVTAPDIRFTAADLVSALNDRIDTAFERHDDAINDATGAVAELRDSILETIGPLRGIGEITVPDFAPPMIDRVARLEPAAIDVSDATDNLFEQVALLIGDSWSQRKLMADAGIIVDPSNGRVTLRAQHEIDERLSQVSVDLDAAKAEIGLRVVVADVEAMIAAAQLDPLDFAAFQELRADIDAASLTISGLVPAVEARALSVDVDLTNERVTAAEGAIVVNAGAIAQRVTVATFEGLETRVATAEETITALGDVARFERQLTAVREIDVTTETLADAALVGAMNAHLAEQRLRVAQAQARTDIYSRIDSDAAAEAARRDELSARIGSAEATAVQETRARVAGDNALSEALLSLAADVGDNSAAILSEQQARVAADAAEATARQALAATVNNPSTGLAATRAQLATADQARASGDAALASRATALEATVNNPTTGLVATRATVVDLAATRVTAAGALAAVEATISAQYGSMSAMAQATSFAEATADGISAGYVLRLNGQGVFEAVNVADGTGGATTTARLAADYVQITGIAQMDTAVIEDLAVSTAFISNLTVDTLQIAEGAVTVPVHLQTGGVFEVESETTWLLINQISLPRIAGRPVQIEFGGQLGGNPPARAFGFGAIAGFRVVRVADGAVVGTNLAHATGYLGARTSYSFMVEDVSLAAGTATYAVQAQRIRSDQLSLVPRVVMPWIRATQHKR